MTACIGTPISWLRLESYALDNRDATVREHLATCPACSASFAAITDDVVVLPPLIVRDVPAPKRWLRWLIPTMTAAAAAAVILLLISRPRPTDDRVTTIKGGRSVVLGVVRERAGAIRNDVTTFATGDRWKVTLTCEPGPFVWVDVSVTDPQGVDYPLGPVQLACGNQVAVAGAFAITGHDVNVVCARLDVDVIPPRTPPHPGEPGVACVTLVPE